MPSLVPLTGYVSRATSPRYRDLARTAAITKLEDARGRFNTGHVGAVYVSREPETACAELGRRLRRAGKDIGDVLPRSMFVFQVTLRQGADFHTHDGESNAPSEWGLRAAVIDSDDMTRCREAASVAALLGAEAVRSGSATGGGQSLALFVEQLHPGSHVDIVDEQEMSLAILAALQPRVPIRELMPSLEKYPLLP